METGLIRYDSMIRAIDLAHEIDEVKDIRHKAMALERYAQLAMNTDAERKACEIRIRAERKAGQMLRDRVAPKGGRPQKNRSLRAIGFAKPEKTLAEIGITPTQSVRWQQLASVQKGEFEAALADPDVKPSTVGIIRKVNGTASSMNDQALWLWGDLKQWERARVYDNSPDFLLGEMTATMQADVKRILPVVIEWLHTLERANYG